MCQTFTPKIITANDLVIGDVVYLSSDNRWVGLHCGEMLVLGEARAKERLGFAEVQHDRVVGVYLADATAGKSGPIPAHFREVFRAAGPSNHPHGKQAEQDYVSV